LDALLALCSDLLEGYFLRDLAFVDLKSMNTCQRAVERSQIADQAAVCELGAGGVVEGFYEIFDEPRPGYEIAERKAKRRCGNIELRR